MTNPIVHVKSNMEVKERSSPEASPTKNFELEMLVEGQSDPVAVKQIKVPASGELIPIRNRIIAPRQPAKKDHATSQAQGR